MGLIIKKRFGPRNFVQYLHLKDVYTVGPKAKKEQQVYVKGGSGYIYKLLMRRLLMTVSKPSTPPDMVLWCLISMGV